MSLIEIEGDEETLGDLVDVEGLRIVWSSARRTVPTELVVAAFAPEEVVPIIEQRGCRVTVSMTSGELDEFHEDVASVIAPPDGLG